MLKLKLKMHKVRFWLLTPVVALLFLLLSFAFTSVNRPVRAAIGINEQINFQGRLLTNTGAVVPDGTYNIEFKVYCGGDGVLGTVTDGDCTHGTQEDLLWTETRESSNKVLVKNGYFSVYLGSVSSFGSNIDWNQSVLWLSVNIGGTGSPSYDGEMSPFNRFGSTPYSLHSKYLGGLAAANFVQLAQGLQADASSSNASIAINKTVGTANILQLQRGGVDVLTVANGGALTVKTTTDSTTAFRVMDADGGTSVLNVDTDNERVGIGVDAPDSKLHVVNSSTSSTGATEYGQHIVITDTGAVTSGGDDNRGLFVEVTRTGGSGTGTFHTYGVFGQAVGDTGGTSTATGVAGVAAGADVGYGVSGVTISSGSGQTEISGVYGTTTSFGFTGTTTAAYALQGLSSIATAGTHTTAAGLLIKTATASGGGAITNNYGAHIQAQSVGTTSNYGLRVDTATTQTLWIAGDDADPTTAAKGIAFGTSRDTNLYRSAADTLKTDDALTVAGLLTAQASVGITGDITFVKEATRTISVDATTTAATAGGALTLVAGAGSATTSGAGGAVSVTGGAAQAGNSNGGAANLTGGAAAGIATGGAVNITAGAGLTGGTVIINGGNGLADGNIRLGSTDGLVVLGHANTPAAHLDIRSRVASTDALSVDNVAVTANIAVFRDNGTAVLTLANGGAATFRNETDSATAFVVQDDAGASLLNIDTTARGAGGGNLIKIGNSTGTNGDTTILQVDSATADPTSNLSALNGGLFYNSSSNKLSIIEGGVVKVLCNTTDAGCGAGGSTSLQSAYNNSSTPAAILLADGKNLEITAADTTTDPSIIFNLQCVTSCSTNGKFAIQSAGTDAFKVAPTGAVSITSVAAANVPLSISGATSQTGDLQQYLNSSAAVIGRVDAGGNIIAALAPPSEALVATASATAGNLNGNYSYAVTFTTAQGETLVGPVSNTIAPASKQADLTAIPLGPTGTKSRKIYRTPRQVDGVTTNWRFVTEINDNTTTTYTDNTADTALTYSPPIPIDRPTNGPVININGLAGNLTGAYKYVVTYVTPWGETAPSPETNSVSPTAQRIGLNVIPHGNTRYVSAVRVYRTQSGGSTYTYVTSFTDASSGTITDPSIVEKTDNTADGSLNANLIPPTDSNASNRPAAPSAAIVATAGNLSTAHTYVWAYTHVNGSGGESALSPTSGMVTPVSGQQQASITSITAGPSGTVARRLYRATSETKSYPGLGVTSGRITGDFKLITTINDNSTTSYTDNIADINLTTTRAPIIGFVGAGASVNQLRVTAPQGTPPLIVSSTTLVKNLNAELLGGNDQQSIKNFTYNIDESLKNFRSALASSNKSPVVVNVIGDSIVDGLYSSSRDKFNIPGRLRTQLQAKYGNGGTGFQKGYANDNWIKDTGGTYNPTLSGANGSGVSFCNGQGMTLKFYGTKIDLQYTKGNFQTISYDIDNGGIPGTINQNQAFVNTMGVRTTLATNLDPSIQHTLRVTAPSGGGNCVNVEGADVTYPTGVRVNNIGLGGSKASDYFSQDDAAIGSFDPDPILNIFFFGTNEWASNQSPQLFKSSYQLWLSQARRSGTLGDCILIVPPIMDSSFNYPQSAYSDVIYQLADENNCGIIDMARKWNNSYSWAQTRGLFGNSGSGISGTDNLHPSDAGYMDIASTLLEFMDRGVKQNNALAVDTNFNQYGGAMSFANLAAPTNVRNTELSAESLGSLTNGNTFRYKVTALNEYGESLPSAEYQFTVALGFITVSWDPVPGATKYRVYRCATTGCAANTQDRYVEVYGTGLTDNAAAVYSGATLAAPPITDTSFRGAVLQGSSPNALVVSDLDGDNVISVDTGPTSKKDNLLDNSGFEKDPGSNLFTYVSFENIISLWSGKGSGTITRDNTQFYEYGSSMKVNTTTAAGGDGAKYPITLSSSTDYELSFWAKTTSTAGTYIAAGYANDGSADTNCTLNTTTIDGIWRNYVCKITTTTVSGTPFVYIKQSDTTARTPAFFVDKVALKKITSTPPTGWAAKGTGATVYRSESQQYASKASMVVQTTGTANAGATYAYTFAASTQYSLSMQIKGSSAAFSTISIGRQDNGSDIDCLTSQTVVTGGWTRFTCTFTTGGTISGSNIYIKDTGTNHTLYVDNVQLELGAASKAFNDSGSIQLNGNITSAISMQNTNDSTTAFQIQNAAGSSLFTVDTLNKRVGINSATPQVAFQVGDAANPSDMAVYGDITKKGVRKQTGLSNIKDIFIYDTARDSDAGAWTNSPTSQLLSWYSEAKDDGIGDDCVIATDDRCDGSRFPQKALLVTTADGLYIFDAVDLKMFMKFTQSGGTFALGADASNDPSGVFAMNGIIYVGTNGTGTGMYAFDFTTDRMFNYNTTDRDQGDKNIANRNTTVTYATDSRTSFAINNNSVNDVHGAVISGSSSAVAAATIPQHGTTFIVAATDSSASVINMSNNKVLDYADTATDDVNQVWLTRRGILYLTNETLAQVERYNTIDTDTADQITPDDIFDEQTGNLPNLAKTTPTISTSPDALQVVEQNSLAAEFNATTIISGDVIYVGHSLGLTEIHDVPTPSATVIGWSKFYKSSGETGLMSGTPRGMFGFNEASGDAVDDTIRANVLEAKGTPTRQINGVHGLGARFNGSSQYFCSDANNDTTCDTDADFDPGLISFTVEAWFKHSTTITGTDVLIDHTYTTTPALAAGYRIYMNSTGTISAGIDDDGTAFDDDIITTTPTYNDGQWHHLVFERVSTALTNPAQAVGTYLYIDGRSVGADTTIAATLTLNGSAILGIGADCSVGAACGTGANFWDGDIDDVYISMNGSTSSDSPNAPAGTIRRKFLEGKSAAGKPSTLIADATTATSTTLGKTGQTYIPNEFVGSIIEITGGTGAGQTRRIIANDATTFTVSPAFTTVPDNTSDYEVIPEQLYGDTDIVSSVGITENDFLGRSRTLTVGTASVSGGGVSVFQGYGNPSVSSVYHTDAGITDDLGNAWSGGSADTMASVDARGGVIAFGSGSNLWIQRDDRNLDQTLDQVINDLASIRQEMATDGLNGITSEFSNIGTGADLAERYNSLEELTAGDVVSMEKNNVGSVNKSKLEYDPELLGIVATEPAITIGPQSENSHPIALSGRVPVKVVVKPGEAIKSGDRITSSSIAGYGMKAGLAGRVIGVALEDLAPEKIVPCPAGFPTDVQCGLVTVFVNLVDFTGENIEVGLEDFESDGLTLPDSILDPLTAWVDVQDEAGVLTDKLQKQDKLLRYLLARKQKVQDKPQSEVLADRLSAFEVNSVNVFAKDIVAGTLTVDKIKANKIEGLEILTDKIGALGQQVAAASQPTASASTPATTPASTGVTFQAITVTDLSVNGALFASGGLKVAGPVEFLSTTVFHKFATFVEKVVFKNDVEFQSKVTFNKDTAGFAVIHPGQQEVEVKFDKPYTQVPVVNITRKNGIFINYAYKDLKPEGFKIVIEELATEDIEFAWSALDIKDAKTVHVPLPPQPVPAP